MEKKRALRWKAAACILAAGVFAAGCGSSSGFVASGKMTENVDSAYLTDAYSEEEASADSGAGSYSEDTDHLNFSEVSSGENSGNFSQDPLSEEGVTEDGAEYGRKLIRNVNITAETESFDDFEKQLEADVRSAGGFIESMDKQTGYSYYSDYRRNAYADYTIRIPSEKLDDFLSKIDGIANVTDISSSTEDATMHYIDVDSERKALETERETLLSMMEKAETVEEMISIQSELADVNSHLNTLKSELKYIDNRVAYSTVTLSVQEVSTYTETEEKTAGQRMKEGFIRNFNGLFDGLKEFGIGFISCLPQIVFTVLVLLLIFFVIRSVLRKVRRKKGKEESRRAKNRSGRFSQGDFAADGKRNFPGKNNPEAKENPENDPVQMGHSERQYNPDNSKEPEITEHREKQ